MHDDDLPVGRVLGRREVVRLLALGGAAAAVGCAGSSATPGAAAAGESAGAVLASAGGRYSGVNDRSVDTQGQKFLRGFQLTDAKGQARFTTIYPGWYQGRAVHIHFKVRTPATQAQLAGASTWEFTSQLFFDDALTDRVFAAAPYAGKGARDRRNADDGIYREGGSQLMLAVAPNGTGQRASFDLGLDLSNAEVGKPDRSGGFGGPPRGDRPRGGRPPG